MLNKIDCPSYIQTYLETPSEELLGDKPDPSEVAIVPWDQFHTLMTLVAANNNKIIEVNTLVSDMIESYSKYPSPILQRAKVYMEGK